MKIVGSPYLEWLKELQFPKINIGSSGMHYFGVLSDLGIEPENLRIADISPYGLPKLKAVLSHRYRVPEDNILTGIGTTGCNYLIFASMFNPGDEVLVETPVYDVLPGALNSLGVETVDLPRRFVNRYQIDIDELQSLFTHRTKAVLITNLHNPSGVRIPDETLINLAQVVASHNCYLIVDEIYLEFYFGKGQKTAFMLGDNIITTSSLTKAFGLGGLRTGWSFAPQDIVQEVQKILNVIISVTPHITEYIAYRFLSNEELLKSLAQKPLEYIEANLPLVESFIDSRPELKWVKPDGGISGFPQTKSTETVERLNQILFEEFETMIIPGKFFGAPEGFRLSYGLDTDMLKTGLNNIEQVLNRLSSQS